MTEQSQAGAWYADPLERFEFRYFDGSSWTEYVSAQGIQARDPGSLVAPDPARTAEHLTTAVMPAASARRPLNPAQRQGAGVMVVLLAAVTVLSAFLAWATTATGSLSGWEWGPAKVTAPLAVLLGLYGAQALRAGKPARFHPGALTVIVLLILIAASASALLSRINAETLGLGDVKPGTGLDLTILAPLIAIVPVVLLWHDYRRVKASDTSS